MNHRLALAILFVLGLVGGGGARADEELEKHLASLREQSESPSQPLIRRSQIVMEMAATLDRAAQAAKDPEERRTLWQRAIDTLDKFAKKNPRHANSNQLGAQAAIYLWARARDLLREAELSPAPEPLQKRALEDLDASLARLREVNEDEAESVDTFAENVRFRLAQTLVDRASLAASDAEKKTLEREALQLLAKPVKEPTLKGYEHLLRGEALNRLDRFEEALKEVDTAAKLTPPPAAADLLDVRIQSLLGRARFEDALKAIDRSALDRTAKAVLTARILLTQRAAASPGEARAAIEASLFRALKELRESTSAPARLMVRRAAKEVEQPDDSEGPDAWEVLADGAAGLGDLARAGTLEAGAADRAEKEGKEKQAQAFRLKAGAYCFQAEKYSEADSLLTRVFDDPEAGASRAKAGLLRAMARGRALAKKEPGANRQAYAEALNALISEFPDDPLTAEAHWLLGQLHNASADTDDALKQWEAIPPGSTHWMESRLAVARLNQEALERLLVVNDREQVHLKEESARRFLLDSRALAKTWPEKAELDLALARLDLTGDLSKADTARVLCERVGSSALSPELIAKARGILLLSLAATNRFVEAEHLAEEEARRMSPGEILETVRWIDHNAASSESDLRHRRFGLLMRILITPLSQNPSELAPDVRWEVSLRKARALLFTGDEPMAKAAVRGLDNLPPSADDDDYRDLADTYFRLEAFELAIEVQRLRSHRNRTGSVPWFEARYGLALAYYRARREREAQQLLDATMILHPELGGGALRDKFIRLRQRLNPE